MTEEILNKIKQLLPLPELVLQTEAVYQNPLNGVITDESTKFAKDLRSKYSLDLASFKMAILNASL